ncbi:MAG: hypothetical protein AAF594_16000, partial [Bacteroidota bacterium]
MKTLALGLLVLLPASGLSAQVAHGHTHDRPCTLRVIDGEARGGAPIDPEVLQQARLAGGASETVTTTRAATFEVQYTGFTSQAQAAFQAAVDIWAAHVESDVTIRVQAQFAPLGENVLGAAGPRLTANFDTRTPPVARTGTWYAFALADAITGSDQFPPEPQDDPNTQTDESFGPDIIATFNSTFSNFYFGTDGNVPAGQFDFRTIVMHELGHGLGFVGSAEVDNGIVSADDGVECDGVAGHGCWGISSGTFSAPVIYDRLVEDGSGVAMTNGAAYPQNSTDLGNFVTSNGRSSSLSTKNIFLDGVAIRAANDGAPAPIYAPRPAEPGSSFSHWDEFVFRPSGGSNALMTAGIGPGESYEDPGALTCALLQDMGWTLAPACSALFPTSEPAGPEAV